MLDSEKTDNNRQENWTGKEQKDRLGPVDKEQGRQGKGKLQTGEGRQEKEELDLMGGAGGLMNIERQDSCSVLKKGLKSNNRRTGREGTDSFFALFALPPRLLSIQPHPLSHISSISSSCSGIYLWRGQ